MQQANNDLKAQNLEQAEASLTSPLSSETGLTLQNQYSTFPVNEGGLGPWTSKYLYQGEMIDRYGSEFGVYASPAGTPFPMRALPTEKGLLGPSLYRFLKPFEVQKSLILPWYGQSGLGTQYLLPKTVKFLLDKKFLEAIH